MKKKKLTGRYELVNCEHQHLDGSKSYPFGPQPTGFLIYSDDGFMAVSMMAAKRKKFKSSRLFGGSKAEKARAMDSYTSYGGTYVIRGDSVIHHIETSLFPNWVGTHAVRFYKIKGNRLTLKTPPFVSAEGEQIAVLEWKKIVSPARSSSRQAIKKV